MVNHDLLNLDDLFSQKSSYFLRKDLRPIRCLLTMALLMLLYEINGMYRQVIEHSSHAVFKIIRIDVLKITKKVNSDVQRCRLAPYFGFKISKQKSVNAQILRVYRSISISKIFKSLNLAFSHINVELYPKLKKKI